MKNRHNYEACTGHVRLFCFIRLYCLLFPQEDHMGKVLYSAQVRIGLRVNFLEMPTSHPVIPPATSGTSLNLRSSSTK